MNERRVGAVASLPPGEGVGPWVGVEKSCKPNAMELATIAEAQPIFMGIAHNALRKREVGGL